MVARYARFPSLEDRGVFISGGASGIGAETVRHFVDQGARVATVDIADPADLPKGVRYRQCDVRDVAALQVAIREADAAVGPIRVLVNNVARDDRFDSPEMTETEWDEMLAVNLRHVFFASQTVRQTMAAAGGGSIINFTSPAAERKAPGLTVYATAKAGIQGLTRSLAGEMGADRIRVNAVQPGWVPTERQRRLWWSAEAEKSILEAQALPELTTEADVARVVTFLASDDAAMVTAQVFVVDGGWT